MRKAKTMLAALLAAWALLWTGAAALEARGPSAELEAGSGAVQGGQEVELLLSLTDCSGVNAVTGTLEYDPAVFIPPSQENLEGQNGWESVVYNPGNGRFALIHRADDPGAGAVMRVTLTARGELTGGDTQVAVTGLSVSGGEEDLIPGGARVTLNTLAGETPADPEGGGPSSPSPEASPGAGEDQPRPEATPEAGGAQPRPETGEDQSQPEAGPEAGAGQSQTGSAPDTEDGQTQPETTPSGESGQPQPEEPEAGEDTQEQSGEENAGAEPESGFPWMIPVFGAAALLIAVVLAAVWRKKGRGGGAMLLAAAVAVTALTAGNAHAFHGKGDLNGDGGVDYLDVVLLQRHLTALEVLPETDQDAADLDGSGSLTVTDLSLLIRRIERTVHYQVSLTFQMENAYYEPGEEIELRFDAQVSHGGQVEEAKVNGDWYPVERLGAGNVCLIRVPGLDAPGVHVLHLTGLRLHSGQEVAVDEEVRIEVLKAAPQVEDFAWERTDGDELEVSFTLTDPAGALLSGHVTITQGDTVLLTQPLVPGENGAAVGLTWREDYTVMVVADYDRDSDALDGQSNRYEGQKLLAAELTVVRDGIQFKDVTTHRLYYSGDGGIREVTMLDVTGSLPEDVEHYYAVVEMDGLPDFYAGIRKFRRGETGRVYAVLDQEDVVSYGQDGTRQGEYSFPVPYRDENGDHPLLASAEELFRQMAADPKGSYRLTEDLDASGLSDGAAAVAGTFTGELDGNGYRILNLPTSLFHTLSGAYIHDLVIENAQVTAARSGILANTIQNGSVVERVFLVDSSISNGVDGLGAFAGSLNNAAIRESASIGVSVKGLVAVGGVVGKTGSGAVIENCYVTGKVQGSYDHPTLGARVGGIAGWHGGGTIRACFAQVQVVAPAQKGNGGLIGGPNTGSPVLEDCLSMSSGAGYRIAGFDVLDSVRNVYEYSGSDSATNITQANRDQVKETDNLFEQEFYVDTLGWDEGVWELSLLAYGKRPSLKAAPERDNNYDIPDYGQVQGQPGYRPDRERAYANLSQLMPFSDVRAWVELGNALEEDSSLVTQTVDFVLALDEEGGLVTGLRRDEPDAIEKIRIVFEDAGMVEYPVTWQKIMGSVAAVYQVEELDLPYQFHRYVGDLGESLLEEAVNLVTGLDYASHIAALTDEEESRLYTDYYNEAVVPKLETVVERTLLSLEDFPTYCEHEGVRALARRRALEAESWKELLYAYNYYDKWYRIDYRGVSLSDLLFFNGELLSEGMTAQALTDKLLAAPASQRETHRTVVFYNSVLKDYTGESLTDFLGSLARNLAGYGNPSDWFAANFDGILKEQAPLYNADKLNYRIWDILSGLDDGRKSIVLAILTAPQEDMYLISMPSQVMIGSLNRYEAYIKKDGGERQRMEAVINAYAEKMGAFYGVSSTWMANSAEILNSFVNIQYDTRLNFPASAAADAGDQDKDKTRDPVMKWVFEANDTISIKNGSAAVANGTNVYWVLTPALGTSDYVFFTFSHETAHNQDGRYFYGGAGRRNGTGAEAHADGNIAQEYRDGVMVFNISRSLDIGTEMPNNFSYERINSPEKLWSYYREMFETGYVLDYLAAQAFLRLEPEEQAAVAVQAVHTPGGTNSFSTTYRALTAEELRQMDLKDLDDLWENRISIRGSLETVGTATEGSYGFESFYCMNWYQSHNDGGSPDTHSFKRLGMEMLGVGGYEAYQIYMSARSENDLDALRQITGREDITWRYYKVGRFRQVAANLDRIPWFDAETVIRQFQAAFERDAQNGTRSEGIAVKRMLYGIVKRATGDFAEGGIYRNTAVISVASAEELIRLAGEKPYGCYRLEADLDFSGITVSGGSYLPGRFIGVLDGNGHKLTGLAYPLFGDLQYAQVTDLIIDSPAFASDAQAMLAVRAKQTVVGEVTIQGLATEDAARQLPLVRNQTGVYYEYGISTVVLEEQEELPAESGTPDREAAPETEDSTAEPEETGAALPEEEVGGSHGQREESEQTVGEK